MASILAVEDNAVYAKLYQAVLSSAGHACEIAIDGPTALERLATGGIELVLMDLYLPGMDGLEVTRAVRATPGMGSLPILAVSARTETGIEDIVREAGCNGMLAKPFKREQLLQEIDALLVG